MVSFRLPDVVDEVARQELLVGAFLLVAGLMFILMGIRLQRLLVALSFGILGFVLGASVPGAPEARMAAGMIVAVGLAGASLWVVRPAVALLGGFWGAATVLSVFGGAGADEQIVWVIAGATFVAAAAMTFVLFHEVVAFITSLEGTLLAIGGLIILFNQNPTVWNHFRNLFVSNAFFAPFIVLSGTVTGFYLQVAELQKKNAGHSA